MLVRAGRRRDWQSCCVRLLLQGLFSQVPQTWRLVPLNAICIILSLEAAEPRLQRGALCITCLCKQPLSLLS